MLTNELRRLGRHVIACDEGRAAESLYSATPERFELLILEQDARRLSGNALAAQAMAERAGCAGDPADVGIAKR